MSTDLPTYDQLLIVSDTGMYMSDKGEIYAYGPVVRELKQLKAVFNKLVWIGFDRPDQIGNRAYDLVDIPDIKLIRLKRVGGKGISAKLSIIGQYPKMLGIIKTEVKATEYIHVRAPSQPALLCMFLSAWYGKKQFWFKYAGSWVDKTSIYYDFQRFLLKQMPKNTKVSVNGSWPHQKTSIISLENPCLSEYDRQYGLQICKDKTYSNKGNYCFVGGLNTNKGIDLLVQAFKKIPNKEIGTLHIVGDGPLKFQLEASIDKASFNVIFHGILSKEDLVNVYYKCQFIVLPSNSEGFPKVISEAMNYGCIPVVSDISCIGQYVKSDVNGYLLKNQTVEDVQSTLYKTLSLEKNDYFKIIGNNYQLAEKFTYKHYLSCIFDFIFVTC